MLSETPDVLLLISSGVQSHAIPVNVKALMNAAHLRLQSALIALTAALSLTVTATVEAATSKSSSSGKQVAKSTRSGNTTRHTSTTGRSLGKSTTSGNTTKHVNASG